MRHLPERGDGLERIERLIERPVKGRLKRWSTPQQCGGGLEVQFPAAGKADNGAVDPEFCKRGKGILQARQLTRIRHGEPVILADHDPQRQSDLCRHSPDEVERRGEPATFDLPHHLQPVRTPGRRGTRVSHRLHDYFEEKRQGGIIMPKLTLPRSPCSMEAMKPATVFLGEMTNSEVEAFLANHHTVIVPVGATEQHGPHAPLLTDVLIPQEVARRVAPAINAVVAPPVNYALSYPHVGFKGLVHIRIPTFMSLIEDLCVSFAASGFKRIVFLNGHYDNTYAIAYACANAADKLPKDVKAFPVNYWDGFTAEDAAEWSGLKNGMHANEAETSAVLAINPGLVDMERANAEFPPFPDYTVNTGPVHTAFFFTSPGSVYWATKSGTWGDPRNSTAEKGERYIEAGVRSTLAVLQNIEKTFTAMPPRQ